MMQAPWVNAKEIIGNTRVTLGPQASGQYLHAPEHLAMVLARYRAAAALIGDAQYVAEFGCGEGIGARILAKGRAGYDGLDSDAAAIEHAQQTHRPLTFHACDVLVRDPLQARTSDAVVSLDVIEHIPADRERDLMTSIRWVLDDHGVCVIGTPSKNAEHLASPQSRAGHVNLYTPERLRALMSRHFHVVQMLYMQDTSLHLGHPGMAHYLIAVGVGPR